MWATVAGWVLSLLFGFAVHIGAIEWDGMATGGVKCGQWWLLVLVFSSPVFFLKTRQLATATGLDHFRYLGTAIGPLKTGPNQSTTQKKLVQISCDWSFVVKFIVPNRNNIISCALHCIK